MAKKHTSILLDDQDQQMLLALQARYHLATAHEALRFALQACMLSPAQYPYATPPQDLKEPQRAERELQQLAERVVHDLQGRLFVVRTALELLSSCPPFGVRTKAKKWIASGMAGVQQLQAVIDQLQASALLSAQESPLTLRGSTAGRHSQRRASLAPGARSAVAAIREASSRGSHHRK